MPPPHPASAPEVAAEAGPTDATGRGGSVRRRDLAAHPGFLRLFVIRLAAQWGDGVFQAALGGAVLFNPEHESDPLLVALGLTVVLLPYSLVGPFAGALLDRWDRRRVFVVAGALRGVLTLATAAVVTAGVTGPGLYLSALATIGVSRFVQAGLSAALPHLVPPRRLVAANSLMTTSGAVMAAVGAACAFALAGLVGTGDSGSGLTTSLAGIGSVAIIVVALGVVRGSLGPDGAGPDGAGPDGVGPDGEPGRAGTTRRKESVLATLRAVTHGLADGARAARAAAGVVPAFWAVAAHRLGFGIATLLTLMLIRRGLADWGPLHAGVAGLGETVAVAAAGLGVAAVVTPWLTARLGQQTTVRIMLALAAVALLALGLPMTLPTVLGAAFVLGLVGQSIKLCSDAAVQREVDDGHRGRVFALSDTVFNATYVLAVTLAALFSPLDGRSVPLIVVAAVIYLLGLVAHELALRSARRRDRAQGGIQPAAPSPTASSTAPSPSRSASSTSQRTESGEAV